MSQNHLSDLRFDALVIHEQVQAGIRDAGFEFCTPIQASTLPIALEGHDVAGQAQTGTGKTAAFLVATYQRLLNSPAKDGDKKQPRAFMLAPTRELAVQIANDAELLGSHTGFKIGLAYGGTDYEKQRRIIEEGIDLLIGTPGRIIDYYKQGVFKLDEVEVAVLDEADRMFDMGFIKDIRYLLRRLPAPDKRLNMLFSATLSHNVMDLAYEHMNEPELIRIEPDKVTADKVRQAIFFPSNKDKMPLLVGLIREMGQGRIMVFVNMKREAERVQAYLQENGIDAQAISGDVPQKKRLRMLMDFQSGDLPVLIGTDVASRGLHIPDVQYVINYDLPQDAEDYVHRIGRTARAGAAGDAISFGCETYAISLPDIEDYIGHKIPVANYDVALLPELKRPKSRPRKKTDQRRGRSSKRPTRRKPPRK
ncbi:MAG: ATP-dependent RNA helicase RhlB [Gammaproteobacteria bacterium]|jgi:ATP-dependent RNA helicase RhlB|nr:ATP-dependent RNA helicase RhlB [Gammaproteobacteria bacterium]MDH3904150.1 ATP-dependent RNA helicase RhlB [Gammaproteobacteria bacterium]MDH3907540.1 ATP-dependent RNA helicase RhlB [Gammaproteobacteria bacterium]MDH3954352.1 ATP-dependent RNA helicase RhlB [Gammaproteobacteria bacterium]MDH4003205.1 ATP-dependent RNA helicase RhlB [Gammaproteobacteria bacterium]